MGAGASAAEVADGIDNVGAAYRGYASKARELGVNGELIAELLQDGGLDEALNDIGVSNSLQRRRLKLEASNQIMARLQEVAAVARAAAVLVAKRAKLPCTMLTGVMLGMAAEERLRQWRRRCLLDSSAHSSNKHQR